jgi:ATPase subunit of ABC transporter with duplicated ATPase domains
LIVVTHDRYFLERVCDVTYALMGDGRCVLLPGGVEQYLETRRVRAEAGEGLPAATDPATAVTTAAQLRRARKDLNRLESQLTRLDAQVAKVHADMAQAASDYTRLSHLQSELDALLARKDELEVSWLDAAEQAG